MSDAVLVAIIAAIPATLGVLISLRANQNAKRARFQVENNHDTNLREESDERHTENSRALRSIHRLVGEALTKLAAVQEDTTHLRSYGRENRRRIEEIERTGPRPSTFEPPANGRHLRGQ